MGKGSNGSEMADKWMALEVMEGRGKRRKRRYKWHISMVLAMGKAWVSIMGMAWQGKGREGESNGWHGHGE